MANLNSIASWPGWETTRLIGRGSFGAVYEIQRKLFEDEDEVEKAALKVISIPQNDSDIEELYNDGYDEESVTSTFHTHLKSIVAEYSLMRKMNGSSNIVNCDDVRYVQHDDGIGWDIYIKMELLTPLAKALPATVSEEQAIKIAKDMCAALELCSKHNIVHRDIKPQNIFVSENGDYKLGDFGIAKTVEKTMGGTKTGTYKYMAPEVYSNRPYNSIADIYSLGLVLYWLLNERRMPFMPLPPEKLKAGMDEDSRNRRFSGEKIPAPKNGSKELKRIVIKACSFDPKDRYQTAREMREDLVRLSNGRAAEFIPEQKPTPILDVQDDTDDNKTMGPIFKHTPVNDADDLDKTVGPVFDYNDADDLDKGNTIKPNTQNKKQKGNKTFGVVAAFLAVGILCSFLLFGKEADKDTEPISVEQTTLGKEGYNTMPLIDSPIDISGSFAQGTYYVSYDPAFYYGFQVIVDQNHRMYLINEGTDNPGSNIICDTGISNVTSAYVGYEYDPSYDCNRPKLYYLTTAKEIWTVKMIPGEKWEIQSPERYGEWADVRQIYIGSSVLPGLVILKENGELYVGSQKIPMPNVVDVQCFFDSIMFRTADGTFYVAGENSYGSFVETTADSIPFELPERLLIPTDVDDACVVRAIINGQQKFRVAILEGGILSIQDKPGNYLVEGFGDVRAIEVADMALYIIHEDGTLYGFGTFSSGLQLTAGGLTEDGICRIAEFDGMNEIMGLAFHGLGCMAVDCDGAVRLNTTTYSGSLYMENGEQFRYGNDATLSSEKKSLIEYVKDEQGQTIKTIYRRTDGTVAGWYESERNESGVEIKRTMYDAAGNELSGRSFRADRSCYAIYHTDSPAQVLEYDNEGNLLLASNWDGENWGYTFCLEYENVFNTFTLFDPGLIWDTKYFVDREFDEEDNITMIKYIQDGVTIQWKKYEYSASGILMKEIECYPWDGSVAYYQEVTCNERFNTETRTAYDPEGNLLWTKDVIFNDDGKIYMEVQYNSQKEITYTVMYYYYDQVSQEVGKIGYVCVIHTLDHE